MLRLPMPLVVALSAWRSRLVQLVDGRRLEPVIASVLPGQLHRAAPRVGSGLTPAVADVARPLRWPQHGRGQMVVRDLPEPGSSQIAPLLVAARRASDVIVDAGVVESQRDTVAVLAAAGAPLRLGRPPSSPTDDALVSAMSLPAATDDHGRELRSIRMRRCAHDELWGMGRAQVSVVLASRRPADLPSAIGQIRRQIGVDVQIVVGLHGDAWPSDAVAELGELPAGAVVERFSSDTPFGSVLDALVERSDGELISKWDDDDWYGDDHLADLVRAYRYSGAELVGKAAEFVRLEGADLTIRRFAIGAENYSTTIAGGTMLTSKHWLREVGGWTPVPRGVDRALLDATARHGGRSYRTHGFQYVLRRRSGRGHTWSAEDDGFAARATLRRAGLDLGLADIWTPTDSS